jgi:nucleotide-binding universal stress UspA family protein
MKILICSDGSTQAERAIRLGATIAAGCHAEATLLGIVESVGESAALLDSLKRGQALLADKKINAELITKSGDPIEEIIKRTNEASYDLVVIGAVRKGTRGPFWMSSKSYKIIKAIQPPVLSVAGEVTTIRRILICSGGKRYIDNAVRLAGEIAHSLGASVVLLHVMPEPPALYTHLPRIEDSPVRLMASSSELGINLRRAKETLESLGVPVEVRLPQAPVLEGILREIHEGGYDLVVTGSALTRSLRTYVLGDISREIVNRTNCAVLVVRSQQKVFDSKLKFRSLLGRLGRGTHRS